MRSFYLLPITTLMAAVLGCRPEGTKQSAQLPRERNLALPAQVPEIEIASPVELGQVRVQQRVRRPTARPASAGRSKPAEHPPQPAHVALPAFDTPGVPPAAQPAGGTAEPVNPRELLPGKTITVIPASSEHSIATEPEDEFPTIRTRLRQCL